MRRNEKGFTLMELMVVIVIVAILAAVAVPLYINYVKDAQRTEAKGAIGAVITAQQTFFQLHDTYATTTFVKQPKAADQMASTPSGSFQVNADLTEALGNWAISTTGDATGYTVTATGNPSTPAASLSVTYTYARATGVGTFTP
jgi:prepilin-type N-terminal cleavage/methylation domain-containing protein